MLTRVRYIFLTLTLSAAFGSFAQTSNSSPYTRYAFGDLFGNTSAYYFGSGSVNIPFYNDNQVNFGNPATYSYIRRYKPVFSVGTQAKILELNSTSDKQVTNSVGLSDFVYGMPVGKKGGAAFGLLPYRTVGYSMIDPSTDPITGDFDYE